MRKYKETTSNKFNTYFYFHLSVSECEDKGNSLLPWIQYKEKCYYASPFVTAERKSWAAAGALCKQNGGFLVSIHTLDELRFILSKVKLF